MLDTILKWWAAIEAANPLLAAVALMIAAALLAAMVVTDAGILAKRSISRSTLAMRIRFRRSFGFWPVPERQSILRKAQQRRIDYILRIRAETLHRAYENENELDQLYSNTPKRWSPKELGEVKRHLAIVRKEIDRRGRRFWDWAHRPADRFGYRVDESYKDYL